MIAAFVSLLLQSTVASAPPPPPPVLDHVMVVWGENRARAAAMSQPYLASLAGDYAEFTNYTAVTHPSQPNYFAMTSGATQTAVNIGCTSIDVPNLADSLEAAGLDWRQYNESMVTPCVDTALYYSRHDFFVNYTNVQENPTRLAKIRGFDSTQPATYAELLGTNPPHVVFVTPNICHGAHDCSISVFDQWLSGANGDLFFQDMLGSKYFTEGAIIVSFDEDDGTAGNIVYFAAIGDRARPSYSSPNPFNHYSFLRTIEDNYGLPTLTANDAAASNMLDAFIQIPSAVENWESY